MLKKIKEKIEDYRRVLRVAKRPNKDELMLTLKVIGIGTFIIGIIGFILYIISTLIFG